MAHNRDVPIAFSFQPQRRRWEAAGFSKAEPPEPQKHTSMGVFGLAVRSPIGETLLTAMPSEFHLHFDGVLGSLRPHTTIRTLSDETNNMLEAICEAQVQNKEHRESYNRLLVSWPEENAASREANPWTMRDEFLRLPETNHALIAFLNRWGVWNQSDSFGGGGLLRLDLKPAMAVLPAIVWGRRAELREAMLGKPEAWLAERASLNYLHRRDRYPYIGITDRTCLRAIETTITLDHLRRTKWRTCKRPDCNNIFPVESDHGKVFCQQYCGHLVSLRRKRAAAKRANKAVQRKKA